MTKTKLFKLNSVLASGSKVQNGANPLVTRVWEVENSLMATFWQH